MKKQNIILLLVFLFTGIVSCYAQKRILAFYTAEKDAAHISFVEEANQWLAQKAADNLFVYNTTNDWNKLNADTLKTCRLVIFLDTRPETVSQRRAFEQYMKKGGAWMGFHFAAFALTPSAYNQNWDWYHQEFLGSGQYVSNTWRPTAARLRTEIKNHPLMKGVPEIFTSAPCEWYRWENDLRKNKRIRILLSIDSSSFPLGTGPKPAEIWHNGYYPVAWTNQRYRMVYMNMGHNDMDYGGTNRALSQTFSSPGQNRFIENCLLWLMDNR